MADNARIEDLRRRVEKDPASIAFAQLAEECRRAGQNDDAVEVCRAGLAIHPSYLSARVTLGRALVELNQLSDAQAEFEVVLKSAPDNLAAIRGLAEIHHRLGDKSAALAQYRAALALARNDPDLERTVSELSREIEPRHPAAVADGMSFEQIQSEFLKHAPQPASEPSTEPAPASPGSPTLPDPGAPDKARRYQDSPVRSGQYEDGPAVSPEAPRGEVEHDRDGPAGAHRYQNGQAACPEAPWGEAARDRDAPAPTPALPDVAREVADEGVKALALRQIAALEQWRDAIHVVRTERDS